MLKKKFKKMIASVLTLSMLISTFAEIGVSAKIVAGSATSMAVFIVGHEIETVYYSDMDYYNTVIPDDPRMFRMKVADRNIFRFYSDSARRNQIKGPIETEEYLSGYQE